MDFLIFARNIVSSPTTVTRSETRKPCTTDAGVRLTETFELLEAILVQLSMRDLWRLQGTNRAFRDTIKNSTLLQRKLWIAYLLEPSRARVSSTDNKAPIEGPDWRRLKKKEKEAPPAGARKPRLNPFLAEAKGSVKFGSVTFTRQVGYRTWMAQSAFYGRNEEFLQIPNDPSGVWLLRHDLSQSATEEDDEASWRRMVLTDFACEVWIGAEEQEGRLPVTKLWGPTLGEVVRESRKRLRDHAVCEELPWAKGRKELLGRHIFLDIS